MCPLTEWNLYYVIGDSLLTVCFIVLIPFQWKGVSSHTHITGGSAVLTVTPYEWWRYNFVDCNSITRVRVSREGSTKR